jgi:hypothetical protein
MKYIFYGKRDFFFIDSGFGLREKRVNTTDRSLAVPPSLPSLIKYIFHPKKELAEKNWRSL